MDFQGWHLAETFKKDKAGNVVMVNPAALKVVKVLFEGQSRKMSANNFLRHIYTPNFSKIFISTTCGGCGGSAEDVGVTSVAR